MVGRQEGLEAVAEGNGKNKGKRRKAGKGRGQKGRSASAFGLPSPQGRLKSTLGTCLADSGAWNSGYSLKPKMPAVMFDGNDRRWVL